MNPRTTKVGNPGQALRTATRSDKPSWAFSLVKVPSGIAEGRTSRGQGNAQAESWSLFMDHAQFQACTTTDPLRFEAPLLFAQLNREFDHVFDRTAPLVVQLDLNS